MNMNKEAIYSRLPVALQNLSCSIEGWNINRVRYSGQFWDKLAAAESRGFALQEEILLYRDRENLPRDFVLHRAVNVPRYRDQFKALRIDPREISTLKDLAQLPVLTKA